jgi:hypothetical protein
MVTLASVAVIKDSFLHEKRNSIKDMVSIPMVFIDIKNKTKRPEEKKRLMAGYLNKNLRGSLMEYIQ